MLRRRFPKAQVLFHALELPKTQAPDLQTRLFGLPLLIAPLTADSCVTEGQTLKIGSIQVTVIHTPGHSPGHVVYYFPGEKMLVGGDMIIGGSIGRTDLPDSDHRDMTASLRKIMKLPPDTRLLPGHGPETTLAEERQTNPYLQELIGES